MARVPVGSVEVVLEALGPEPPCSRLRRDRSGKRSSGIRSQNGRSLVPDERPGLAANTVHLFMNTCLPFTVRCLPFTAHCSPFTVHCSRFTAACPLRGTKLGPSSAAMMFCHARPDRGPAHGCCGQAREPRSSRKRPGQAIEDLPEFKACGLADWPCESSKRSRSSRSPRVPPEGRKTLAALGQPP